MVIDDRLAFQCDMWTLCSVPCTADQTTLRSGALDTFSSVNRWVLGIEAVGITIKHNFVIAHSQSQRFRFDLSLMLNRTEFGQCWYCELLTESILSLLEKSIHFWLALVRNQKFRSWNSVHETIIACGRNSLIHHTAVSSSYIQGNLKEAPRTRSALYHQLADLVAAVCPSYAKVALCPENLILLQRLLLTGVKKPWAWLMNSRLPIGLMVIEDGSICTGKLGVNVEMGPFFVYFPEWTPW